MSESLILQLQEVAREALQSENLEEGMKHLAHAFSLFSQETGRLKASYDRLCERFETVNRELEQVNVTLRTKNKELSLITTYLDNLLKKISQGIIFIDREGIITTYNEEAQKILKKEENEVLFKPYKDTFEDEIFGFSMSKALKHKLSAQANIIKIEFPNEETMQLEVSTTYIDEAIKPYEGMIVIFRDVTQIQKLQIAANRNDRLKELGEMAARVAHEIRNPLGGIRGFAALLYRDLEESKHLQEMAGYILEGSKTLERLVNNVLHYSRPVEIKPSLVDIGKYLKEIADFARADPNFSKEVALQCHIPKDKIMVSIDKGLFHSAILNIIVNAYQAIESKGTITICAIKNNDNCVISLSDTGNGIEAKDLEKIFTPFFTTKERGNGLGLSEASKIVQAHLGTIDVRSKPNFGTTFTINIPLSKQI